MRFRKSVLFSLVAASVGLCLGNARAADRSGNSGLAPIVSANGVRLGDDSKRSGNQGCKDDSAAAASEKAAPDRHALLAAAEKMLGLETPAIVAPPASTDGGNGITAPIVKPADRPAAVISTLTNIADIVLGRFVTHSRTVDDIKLGLSLASAFADLLMPRNAENASIEGQPTNGEIKKAFLASLETELKKLPQPKDGQSNQAESAAKVEGKRSARLVGIAIEDLFKSKRAENN